MSVHGYKVDKAELQKALNNLTSRQINQLSAAGEKAMDDISRNTIDLFYQSIGSAHNYSSLAYSLKVKRNPPKQNSKMVWVDIDMYIDPSAFLYATEDFYEIYKWADRPDKKGKKEYRMTHPEAADFVISLQWTEGVVGLPIKVPDSQYITSPLEKLMEDEIKRIWERRVRKYL